MGLEERALRPAEQAAAPRELERLDAAQLEDHGVAVEAVDGHGDGARHALGEWGEGERARRVADDRGGVVFGVVADHVKVVGSPRAGDLGWLPEGGGDGRVVKRAD